MRILSQKSEIQDGDTLNTQRDSYAQIKFPDGGQVTMKPNTTIKVPGLVKVVINEHTQLRNRPYNGIAVRALHVIALPDAPEDIAGIDLELGVAAAWVQHH